MSRATVKQSLQTLLQGVSGVKSVFTAMPRRMDQFPAIFIALEKTAERAVTMGNPAKRHIRYTASLYIRSIDMDPNEQASQQRFDTLLDDIDTALRGNKSLSGTVLSSAWEHIDTDVYEPVLAGQGAAITLSAIKTFDVVVEIIG